MVSYFITNSWNSLVSFNINFWTSKLNFETREWLSPRAGICKSHKKLTPQA